MPLDIAAETQPKVQMMILVRKDSKQSRRFDVFARVECRWGIRDCGEALGGSRVFLPPVTLTLAQPFNRRHILTLKCRSKMVSGDGFDQSDNPYFCQTQVSLVRTQVLESMSRACFACLGIEIVFGRVLKS